MAKHPREPKDSSPPPGPDGPGPASGEGPPLPDASPPEAGEGPSPEDRLAALEAALAEQRHVIATQATVIAQGVENAVRLRRSRERIARLESAMDAAKREASAAKKAYEAGLKEHLELEAELDDDSAQGRLPLGDPGPAPGGGDGAPPGDDSWRQVLLFTLGIAEELPRPTVGALAEAGIKTVGDLADFTRPDPSGHCKRLIDVPGIGEKKAEQVEAALDAFWSMRAKLDLEAADRGYDAAEGAPPGTEGDDSDDDVYDVDGEFPESDENE